MGPVQAVVDRVNSLLFVPGNDLSRIGGFGLRADALVLDLETAVVGDEKNAERRRVSKQLRSSAANIRSLFVRVNPLDSESFREELDLVAAWSPTGIVVPDWEDWQDLGRLDALLKHAESGRAGGRPPVEVILIVETEPGVERCRRLSPIETGCRTIAVAFGANDYAKDVGVELDWSSSQLDEPRRAVLHASSVLSARAFDTAYPLDSLEDLRRDALKAKSLGFDGKFCKHPDQVDAVNEVFRNSILPDKRDR